MTESLTERLRQRAATQTAESEKILSAELSRLTSGIRTQLSDELASIQSDISGTSLRISSDLADLKWVSRYWWIALLVTWIVGGGLLTWHSMTEAPSRAMTLGDYQTFQQDGRTYLIVPPGSEVVTCMRGEKAVGCVLLPQGE